RSANGRPIREYLASSLTASPLTQPVAQTALSPIAPPDSLPLFSSLPKTERIALPDPDQQKEAQRRHDALLPVLDFAENPRRYDRLQHEGRPVTSLERMICYAAAQCGQSPRTLKRWLASYRASGFAALADRTRHDKGKSRWFARHPEARTFAAYLYLVERMSVSFV